jgi:hypothetical protein
MARTFSIILGISGDGYSGYNVSMNGKEFAYRAYDGSMLYDVEEEVAAALGRLLLKELKTGGHREHWSAEAPNPEW